MAHFVRLIVGVLLLVLGASAFAQIAPVTASQYSCNGPGFPSEEGALNYWISYTGGAFYRLPGAIASGVCFLTRVDSGEQVAATAGNVTTQSTCPANSTLSGASCFCNAPTYVQQGASCVLPPNPCANFGTLLSSYNGSVQMVQGASSVCMGGCQVNFKAGYEGADLYGAGTDGVLRGWVPVGQLESPNVQGSCASPTEPAVEPVADVDRPPAGTCPGEVNGVTVNVPCSRTETNTTKATTENDGVGNSTVKNESKSTTCTAAGSCTTTTTTTTTVNGGAPTTSTKTSTLGKGQFCAENPGAKECGDGDGSAFGGSCDAGFICEGDAVQCALAKEVHTQHCKLNKVTDESTLYGAEKGREGDQTGDLPGNETIPFGPSSFDDSDALGGGACLTDLTLSNQWIDATLPLSAACGALEWFRYLLLAVGSFAWMLIVFRK